MALEIPKAGMIPEVEAESLDRSQFSEFEGLSDDEIISLVTQTIAPPSAPAAPPPSDSNFFPAMAYGADSAQAALGAGIKALGQGLDIEGMEEYGRDLQERNLQEAQESAAAYTQISLDDVAFGDNVTNFVIQTLGETLPSMGIALGGAGVAAIGAIPLGLTGAAAGAVAGAGAFLPSALMGTGETQIKMESLTDDKNYEDPSTALAGGLFIGALDTAAAAVPFVRLLGGKFSSKAASDLMSKTGLPDGVLKGAKKTATDALSDAKGDVIRAEASIIAQARDLVRGKPQSGSRVRAAARGGAEQFALEGLTEGTQEAVGTLLAEGSTGKEDEAFASSILEAAVKGGIAGFSPGAVVRAVKTDSKAAQREKAEKLQKFEEKLTVVTEEEGFDTASANPAEVQVVEEEEVIRFTDTDKEGKTRVRDITVADFEGLEAQAIVDSSPTPTSTPTSTPVTPEVAAILDGEKEGVDIGRQADVMGLTDRDGLSFSYDGDGIVTFLKELDDLKRESLQLKADLELRIKQQPENSTEPTTSKRFNLLQQREEKIKVMENILRQPSVQATIKSNPSLQSNIKNINNSVEIMKNDLIKKSIPEGLTEEQVQPYLLDLDGTQLGVTQEDANIIIEQAQNAAVPQAEGEMQSNLSLAQAGIARIEHLQKQVPFLKLDPRELTRFRFSPKRFDNIGITRIERVSPVSTTPAQDKNVKNLEDAVNKNGPPNGVSGAGNLKDNGPQGMLNRVGLYMKFMSSNKRLADRYPELRPIYNLVKKYNEEWFSIITQGIEGRTVALALPREKRKAYRIMRTVADDLGIRIEFSGVSDVAESSVATIAIPGATAQDRQRYVSTASPYKNPYQQLRYLESEQYVGDGEQVLEGGAITVNNGVITLTDPAIVNALQQEQNTADSLWNNVITSTIFTTKEGLQKEATKQGVVDFNNTITNAENSILAERELNREELNIPETDQLFIDALKRLALNATGAVPAEVSAALPEYISVLEALTNGRKQGYFPRIRNGDVIIRVFENVRTVDKNGEPTTVRKVVYRRDVNTPIFKGNKGIEWATNKYESDLRSFYPDADIQFSFKENENASIVIGEELNNLSILESILIHEASLNQDYSENKILFQGVEVDEDGAPIEGAQKTIKDPSEYIRMLGRNYRNRKETVGFERFKQHRQNIPGYITPENEESYHDNAWAQYVTSLGRYVAKGRTKDAVTSEIDRLAGLGENQQLRTGAKLSATPAEVAEAMWKNTITPQGAASALKSFAFYGFLGGNFSSSFLNLTQSFVTASLLYGAYGKIYQPKVAKAAAAAAKLSIFYHKNQAFLKSDRDEVARILKQTGAARTIEEGQDQFDKLYILQERGSLGRINTAALSQNADLTTDFWYDKLQLNKVEDLAKSGLDPKQMDRFKKFANNGKKLVDGVYATTEVANRIAAALATYNTVKASSEGMGPLREFARNTASGVDSQNADRLIEIEDGMQYIIDESQFNLSAFNRPRLAFAGKGLAGVTLQFIPFVTMMLEVYANAMTRYGGANYGTFRSGIVNLTPQGRRTLAFLILPQVILGGMFGLPFADDIKEVIKALIRSPIGTSLNLQQADMELAFYDIMTNNFGPEALSLAEAIARGPIKAWGGVDISQRVSLSPFRSFIEAATGQMGVGSLLSGPSGSFFTNAIGKSFDAFERNDYGKAILRLTPLAVVQNAVNAWEAGEDGVFSGKGRPLADGLGPHDLALMTLGFAPENVYGPRDRLYREKAYATKSNAIKDKYLDKVLRLMVEKKNTDSAEGKRGVQEEIEKLFKEVRDHDRGQKNIWDKIDPSYNIRRSANTRYINTVSSAKDYRGGPELMAVRRGITNPPSQ